MATVAVLAAMSDAVQVRTWTPGSEVSTGPQEASATPEVTSLAAGVASALPRSVAESGVTAGARFGGVASHSTEQSAIHERQH